MKHISFPSENCIHELFELQVEKNRNKPALIFGGRALTYAQLSDQSNQLAHFLLSNNVHTEELIAICVDRSLEMIVGILGILKAGAAYVPIDPEYPIERKLFMLEDTQASIILTQSHLLNKIPNNTNATIICLDTDKTKIEKHSSNKVNTNVTPANLIYTIYTSGSTGKPKGVQIEHRNVVNLIQGQMNFVQHPVDRFLYAYSFAFDGSVLLIWWTLLQGATLVIAANDLEKDVQRLGQFIFENKITHLLTFPSVYSILLERVKIEKLLLLQSVSVAGEACPGQMLQVHHKLLPNCKLLNQYGPTEATVGCTIYITNNKHTDPKVPIGRPIDNTQIYLLDKNLNELATGETGEIYIGGKSVARGYLNRPQLTKERFINNPFTNNNSDKIYKTGDLARMLPDGNIDFIGRDDYQIKLRGYRIELGEIEAQILKHPFIRETVVTVVGENSTDKKLVAYLVFVNGKSLTVSELRTYLAKQLAEYMIPAAYVVLEKMPLATSGKIDRKALPSLGNERPDLEQAFVAASTDLEKYIAQLWCKILNLKEVGLQDKFFELGGNSLQAAKFISQLQKELKTNIFIVTIFEAPSIAEYVDLLKRDYAEAIQNRFEKSNLNQAGGSPSFRRLGGVQSKLQQIDFDHFDQYVPQLIPEKANPKATGGSPSFRRLGAVHGKANKNKKAIFILAPPRSGTTLLRVMLAGHPDLFAANELQLLGFQTMKARKEAYSGKFSLWLEGAVRTVMELKNCDANKAKNIIQQFVLNNKTTKSFYHELQNWIGEKILVDKSPSYALDYNILQKAEQDFEDAIYIQLVRHPYAMIRSFEKMHMDQVMYLHEHQYNARQTGELIWTKSHQNINRFLQQIPAHRQFRLSYEDLVRQPKLMMQALCENLALDFHPSLVNPYQDIEQKMTDGLYEHSKPMGDPKLLQHKKIDPKLADTWKGVLKDNFLSETTWKLATDLAYPNIKKYKGTAEKPNENIYNSNYTQSTGIAIIGMSGRFPGAKNLQEFWQNLEEGKDVSKVFNTADLLKEGVNPQLFNSPDYVNRGMPLADADCFDAQFFGYLPKEAALMDPQHRIFLELAYAALEDAAYDPSRFKGEIGVFGGIARNTYLINNVLTHPNYFKSLDDFQIGVGLEKDFPATKVAYKLNLNGPAVNVQTACSSSGVAVHLACQSLLLGDADMLIVGGGRIQPPVFAGHQHTDGHALSPDGYCRTFDADAKGMVRGNGMAMIVLKRLDQAIEDGDTIHAIIKATAIGNDGGDKVGFTAPSVQGQSKTIAKAYQKAGINPETIQYIEAHGTGTILGDPIEVAALSKAFQQYTDKKKFCGIGSVKTNIGHLDAGACVAGIIKTVLALKHEKLPASLNYKKPNPQIDFENSPFYVNNKLKDWKRGGIVRRAGVSSFGLGGTNAHIIIEEAPFQNEQKINQSHHLLLLSAKKETALLNTASNLSDFITNNPQVQLANIAHTLQTGRVAYTHRLFLVTDSKTTSIDALQTLNKAKVFQRELKHRNRQLVFMFPGGGAQHSNMGLDLYEQEPVFRNAVDQCLDLLKFQHDLDVREVLYPNQEAKLSEPILNPLHAITLLFTIEYATAQLLLSWGLIPKELIGHSLGEYTAACIAGVMDLEDALALVAKRGILFQELDEGTMLSIPMPEAEVIPYMDEHLSFAAINKPDHCVVSGSIAAIDRIKQKLNQAEIHSTKLHITVAAHSHMVEPILEKFERFLNTIKFKSPRIPIVSNLNGNWADEAEIASPKYWVKHLRQTVRFSDGIETLLELDNRVLLEVGPGQTLSTFARQHPVKKKGQLIFASLRHPKEQTPDLAFLLKTLGNLWLAGIDIHWENLHAHHTLKRISLPSYPFEKQRHWITVKQSKTEANSTRLLDIEQSSIAQTNFDNSKQIEKIMIRKELIIKDLKEIFYDLSGITPDEMNEQATFLELGFDSLFLTQSISKIKKKFKIKLSFRQLFEDAPTIDALGDFINEQMPETAYQEELKTHIDNNSSANGTTIETHSPAVPVQGNETLPAPQVALPIQQITPNVNASSLENIINNQLLLMQQQLALLGAGQFVVRTDAPKSLTQKNITKEPTQKQPNQNGQAKKNTTSTKTNAANTKTEKDSEPSGVKHGPWKPISKKAKDELSPTQRKYLEDLIKNYNQKTKGSQQLTQSQRKHLADPRSISGFNKLYKDLIYQIASVRSKGSKFWDIDGNEYVDYRMAFGISLFGHTPDFVQEGIKEQLEKGFELGMQTPLARKVGDLLAELTKMDRVTFVNTGSEAISASVRAARTVTYKDKIAVFEGDYHGIADEMLVRGVKRGDRVIPMPVAPGIPQNVVSNVIVLNYDDPNVLEKITAQADELAAVIIEPIQPNFPIRQPKELFQAIRKITAENDIAMIFDEMITGFRLGMRGAQEWYGVDVDIVAYGKIISGGLPMAAVAGKGRFMDAFDGGQWQFGDDSFPEAGVTFFGGTYVRHPLSLAASYAMLKEIKRRGPELYTELNAKSARFAERIKELFERTKVPLQIFATGSILAIRLTDTNPLSKLFFYYMIHKGVHMVEKAALISTAHTEADLDFTYRTMEEAIKEMQTAGFFQITVAQQDIHNAVIYPPNSTKGKKYLSLQNEKDITSFEGNNMLPLTDGQKEIWIEQQLSKEAAAAYNLASDIQLQGNLDIEKLSQAVELLIDRHEAMRAQFNENTPSQYIVKELKVEIPIIDLSAYNNLEKIAKLNELRHEEGEKPIDLFNGSAFRFKLIRLEEEEHRLFMTVHHMIADGWSCGILAHDLGEFYTQLTTDKNIVLGEAKQLSEYLLDQAAYKETAEHQEAAEFWLQQYKDDVPVSDFPTDYSRPRIKTYQASLEKLSIDQKLYSELKQLAAKQGSTFFVILYSAFQTFIHRLSQQEDIVLGVVAAGQAIAGNENMVAHGVNLLPVRMKVQGDTLFEDHLKNARGAILDAFDFQNYTLGALVKQLNLPRDLSRQPIISILFNMDSDMGHIRFGELAVNFNPIPRNYETFDIFINVKPTATAVDFEWIYNTDLFKKETIELRLKEFNTLLESIVANPNQRLSELDILPKEEKEILHTWNQTQGNYPKDICIHQLIEEQVKLTPNKIAVESKGQVLNYQKLNYKANQLARTLVNQGAKKGDFIGVYINRSAELIVGLLAILKIGGIYVPLDPSNPADRLRTIIDDAAASFLITQQSILHQVPKCDSIVINVDEIDESLSKENLNFAIDSKDFAYVNYTSGSTGKPKGVVIPHFAVIDHHYAVKAAIGINADERIFAVASISFDPSVQDFFLPLFIGASVFVADQESITDGYLLKELMQSSRGTLMQATPATWRMLITAGWKGSEDLTILCGGEGLTQELANSLIARSKTLYNIYGPTETTIWSTLKKIETKSSQKNESLGYLPIGKPIRNVQIYILDKLMQRVPIGAAAELYIGGVGVAPGGYFKREELTKEKFVADPFNGNGQKLYRTGDIARYLSNGDIEYLRRADNQVKIRGFRIELGEIESAISQYASIAENVVIVREDQKENKRLVAYLICKAGVALDLEALKNHLKEKLPAYMIPSAFVEMKKFPLTSSLKINRKKLPLPDYSRADLKTGFVAPTTEMEQQLNKIWTRLLGIKKIGIYDNFFELGGHSLIAVQMMTQVLDFTGKKLPLAILLQNPTIHSLAKILSDPTNKIEKRSLIPIKASGTKTPIYILHGAGNHVMLFNTLAQNMDTEQPVYGLEPRGLDGEAEPLNRIEDIAQHYISEILADNPNGPYALAGYSFGGLVAFEMAKQLTAMGKEVSMLAMFDTVVRAEITGKKDAGVSKITKFSKKLAWNLGTIAKNPITNIQYKSNSIKHKLQRWKRNKSSEEELQNDTCHLDYSALVDKMHQEAFSNYRITPYEGKIHIFRAKERRFYMDDFKYLGWKPYAKGGIEVSDVPGDHLTLFNPPNGAELARILQFVLDNVNA